MPEPPDAVISDLGMPREDGQILLRRMRSLETQTGGKVPSYWR